MSFNESLFKAIAAKTTQSTMYFPIDGGIVDPFTNKGKAEVKAKLINARLLVDDAVPTIEKEGFTIVENKFISTDVLQAYDEGHDFEPLKNSLLKLLGAKHLLNLGHVPREEDAGVHKLGSRMPATLVHSDWNTKRLNKLGVTIDPYVITNKSLTPKIISDFLGSNDRWMIVNCWLPLSLEVNCPIALCDLTSVDTQDMISDLRFKNSDNDQATNDGNFISLNNKKTHRWYYYPLMQTNEMLVFQQFSSEEGVDHFKPVFHTACNLIEDKKLINRTRKSIEIRFIAKF
mgnify:CR=1 FL=1